MTDSRKSDGCLASTVESPKIRFRVFDFRRAPKLALPVRSQDFSTSLLRACLFAIVYYGFCLIAICRSRAKSRGFSKFRQNGTSQIHLLFSVLVLHLPRFITGCMTLSCHDTRISVGCSAPLLRRQTGYRRFG